MAASADCRTGQLPSMWQMNQTLARPGGMGPRGRPHAPSVLSPRGSSVSASSLACSRKYRSASTPRAILSNDRAARWAERTHPFCMCSARWASAAAIMRVRGWGLTDVPRFMAMLLTTRKKARIQVADTIRIGGTHAANARTAIAGRSGPRRSAAKIKPRTRMRSLIRTRPSLGCRTARCSACCRHRPAA